jgi:hypothetical protein
MPEGRDSASRVERDVHKEFVCPTSLLRRRIRTPIRARREYIGSKPA